MEYYFYFSSIEDKIVEEETPDANKLSETGDEKVLDLNQIHLMNNSIETEKHKILNETSTANEPCMNGEGMKKTRKNGVCAYETIPNGKVNETTDTTKTHSVCMKQNCIPECDNEQQNGCSQSAEN